MLDFIDEPYNEANVDFDKIKSELLNKYSLDEINPGQLYAQWAQATATLETGRNVNAALKTLVA